MMVVALKHVGTTAWFSEMFKMSVKTSVSSTDVLPTSSRNSWLYVRLKTGRRDEDIQKHCDLQDKKHQNTILSGEREAAASVCAAMLESYLQK